jgi:hypothetical protein
MEQGTDGPSLADRVYAGPPVMTKPFGLEALAARVKGMTIRMHERPHLYQCRSYPRADHRRSHRLSNFRTRQYLSVREASQF